ncbi:MAG TPA: FecR family protein [Gammaproteobacteria bacterium]|nr:FecR family protein [Gammaproteobacteria bacterium]
MKSFYVKGLSFFLFILFEMTFFSFSQSAFAAIPVGQMVWVRGNVQVIDASNRTQGLQRRSPVYERDTIVTNSGSAQIVFTDNSLVVLREGTTFHLAQYKFNPGAAGDSKYVADMAKGGFRTITGLISRNNPEGYQVNTPVATIGVRGTSYSADLRDGLTVKLESGALFVTNSQGTAQLNVATNQIYAVVKGAHTAPAVSKTPPPMIRELPAIVPATMSTGSSSSAVSSDVARPVSGGGTTTGGFCIK